ncbi:Ig-like domain-containing protein [Sphingomonas sp. IW22]|uniref:Ig-like domain-containing protein n=1 Tax=Sphingomonas sp. IW22 TaxID=3242489 RepID=UPI00352095DC
MATLAACSGGDGGGGSGPSSSVDGTAPVVTISANSDTVVGGAQIVFTATANDAVDGALTPQVSCNGGTLTGLILQTQAVTAPTTIQCSAVATDKAGNRGTAQVVVNVQPANASLVLTEGQTGVAAGGVAVLTANDIPLSDDAYQATIGGQPVTVVRSAANQLAFIVPTGLSGAQTLAVTIGGRTFNQAVTVGAAPAVADPRGVVANAYNVAIDNISRQISAGSGYSAAEINLLTTQRSQLQQALANLGNVPNAEVEALAAILVSSGLTQSGASAGMVQASFNPGPCRDGLRDFVRQNMIVAKLLGIAAIGAYTSSVFPVLGPTVAVLSSGTAIGLLVGTDGILDQVDTVLDACFEETELQLLERIVADQNAVRVRPLSTTPVYGFESNKAKSFELKALVKADDSVVGSVSSAFATLGAIVAKLPVVPDSVNAVLPRLKTEREENVDPRTVSLGAISRGDITGSAGISGSNLVLKFNAAENAPNGNLDFLFNLNRPNSEARIVSARLMVARPEADDASIQVRQGTPTQSNVQVRGAETLEVVGQPSHGSVTLGNDGRFVYTPAGSYFGDDKFTFRGRNSHGVSNTATVLVSVVRQFEGAWALNVVSTTRAESHPGLCPNENNNVTVNIAKISDTQYSANYLGFEIPLTMSSKDDPNGLRGSASATYADDPGRTSETLTVQLPSSAQLIGSSTWSYSGPGGTNCSGVTRITGTRP